MFIMIIKVTISLCILCHGTLSFTTGHSERQDFRQVNKNTFANGKLSLDIVPHGHLKGCMGKRGLTPGLLP